MALSKDELDAYEISLMISNLKNKCKKNRDFTVGTTTYNDASKIHVKWCMILQDMPYASLPINVQ